MPDTISGGAGLAKISAKTSTVLPQPCMHHYGGSLQHQYDLGSKLSRYHRYWHFEQMLAAHHLLSQEAAPGARSNHPACSLEDGRPPESEAAGGLVGDPEVAPVPPLAALVVQHEAQRLALVRVQLHRQPGRLRRVRPLPSLQPFHQRLKPQQWMTGPQIHRFIMDS